MDENPWILRMAQDIDLSALVARMTESIKSEVMVELDVLLAGSGFRVSSRSSSEEARSSSSGGRVLNAVRGRWATYTQEQRNARGETQGQFARRLGIHPITVSTWERGAPPSLRSVEKVLTSLDGTIEDVLGKAEYRRLTGAAT